MPRKKKEHLKRRKDGRFRCVWHGMAFYSYDSAEDAIAKRDEYREMVEHGFRRQTVQEYALPWLKRSYPSVAKSTYRELAIHLQHLIDAIGEKLLFDVLPSDIKQIYSDQYAACSATYIAKAKQVYCDLFDAALADHLITFNPARDRTAKPHKGNAAKPRILTKQQRTYIETLCTDHRAFPVVMAMLYAGLRPQEVKAILIERDVDFTTNTITIHQTAHLDGSGYVYNGVGKTDKANRQVPLFKPLRAVLDGKTGYLAKTASGQQITTRSAWRQLWDSYICSMETAINGIPKFWYGRTKEHRAMIAEGKPLPPWIPFDIVPYTLRHAFCAFCRDSGVELNTCRHWMGHANTTMILQIYDSVSVDRSETEREKVETKLFQSQKEGQQKNEVPKHVDK